MTAGRLWGLDAGDWFTLLDGHIAGMASLISRN
jgi:hypothetical protein